MRGRGGSVVATLVLLARGGGGAAAQDARDTTRGTPADTSRAAPITSQAVVTGQFLSRLPIDDPRQGLTLVPGVVLRSGDIGIAAAPALAIRGSPPGVAGVYVDGAPVRFELIGTQGPSLGTPGIDAVAVTTGVPDASVADARGGVISYVTHAGGAKLEGHGRADSDEPFWNGSTVGYNRFEGEMGGPLPVPQLTWFAAGTLQGQRSQYYGRGAADQPAYVVGGGDAIVPDTAPDGTVTNTVLPKFVQWSGSCGAAGNYGYDCQGLRRPLDWSTLRRGQTKLSYSYGTGSSLSFTGILVDLQQRAFPGTNIADPALYRGSSTTSRLGVLNWSHALGAVAGSPLTLSANLSLGSDEQIDGPLSVASELATRDRGLGIEWRTLEFTGADIVPFPVTDDLLRTVRTNSGLPVPFPNRTDLNVFQTGRLNPYGVQSGWPTNGLRTTMARAWEQRLDGRAQLEWRPGTHHQLTLGGEAARTDLSLYEAGLTSLIGCDAFRATPHRYGVFASDRVKLGSLVVEAGARWDHYNANALFPNTPGFTFSNPRAALYPNAATDPAQYAAFLADTGIWTPSRGHHALSPRLRAGYALSSKTSVRIGYGQQAELPSFADVLASTNNDLTFTSTSTQFGRDVDYAKPVLMELGVGHELATGLSLDVSLYHRNHIAPFGLRILPFANPRVAGDTIFINVLTKVDGGHGTGVDALFDWHPGDILHASVSYSFLTANLGFNASTFLGSCVGCQPDVTTHALYAVANLAVPDDWKAGTPLGAMAKRLGAVLIFRLTTGLPYTRLVNNGAGQIVPQPSGEIGGQAAENINASHLPTTKTLDLRLTKGLRAGGRDVTLYADVRNLFNFTNIVALYAETGAVTNDFFKTKLLSPELANLGAEASQAGALNPDGSIDLSGNCNAWGTPANCVALRRVEARFGNGDLLYTPAEQTHVLDTYYNSFFGPWRFYGPARTVRVGVEVGF